MGITEKDGELKGVTEVDSIIGSIVLIQGEITYIVGCNNDAPKTYNQKALVSKLAEYFKKGDVSSIQVLRVNEEYPFFEEINEEKLIQIYQAHKNSLEGKTSS